MKLPDGVVLLTAKYFEKYKYIFTFSNEVVSIVDFEPIIKHGFSLLKFLDVKEFKKIKISDNKTVIHWGDNYDMSFHIEAIYKVKAIYPLKPKSNAGRKDVEDKKVLLALYVRKSVIAKHGGKATAQKEGEDYFNNN